MVNHDLNKGEFILTILILFGSLIFLILLSVPIGIAIGMSTIIATLTAGDIQLIAFIQRSFNALDSFPLMAIPLFILAGIIMGKGGVAKRLLSFAESLIGFIDGGFAIITVIVCMFFAAISGSGPATVAAIGSFMIPAMIERGYGSGFAAGITAAAGSVGAIIPPSISFIVLGVAVGVSVSDLFLGGVIPGILVGIALIIYSYFKMKKKKNSVSSYEKTDKVNIKNVWITFRKSIWSILAPFIILGGIYTGFFTPTEAAAVAVIYALLIGALIHKELKWKDIYDSFIETFTVSGGILYLIGLSMAFAYFLSMENIPSTIAEFMIGNFHNPIIVILLINLFLIIVGAFMETVSAIVILSPLLLPIATEIGMEPVHFGVMMILNLTIGYITPPVGVNLFVASSIGKTPFEKVTKSAFPLLLVLLVVLLIVSFVPQLSLFLPEIMN